VADPARLRSAVLRARGPFYLDGDTYLVYDGAARKVELITWMPRFPPPPGFTRLEGTSRWYLPLPLPATARIEYRLRVRAEGRVEEIDDPLNPPAAPNPFGVNSVVTGPGYRPAPPTTGPVAGGLLEIRVPSARLGGRRHHQVYLPPGFARRTAYPLLLVHDGSDFARYAGLVEAIDGMIGSGQVAPLVGVLLDPWARLVEYAALEAHSHHVVEEVIPHLRRRVGVESRPSDRGMLGSSLGAVAALATARHHPEHFGRLGLISGTFVHSPHPDFPRPTFEPVMHLVASLRDEVRLDGYRVFASAGRYEALVDLQRHLLPVLRAAGAKLEVRETWDGHDWGSWRNRLFECLPFLYPPDRPGSDHPSSRSS
jgi:enterochelin esterase family protein